VIRLSRTALGLPAYGKRSLSSLARPLKAKKRDASVTNSTDSPAPS